MNLEDINSDEYKDLHCTKCSDWLKIEIKEFDETIEGIHIYFDKLPFLVCPTCSEVYFPFRTKILLRGIIEEAKRRCVNRHKGTRRENASKQKYNFCKKVDFDYDSSDYDYIPGLIRPWRDGAITPVFFDRKVLQKFQTDPDYSVTLGSNTYGTIYHPHGFISFGINRNNRVIFWLYDLDKLPENEQYYLKSFNIPSDHDLGSDFYKAQIEVEYGELSNEKKLFEKMKSLNKNCQENTGIQIFRNIDEDKIEKVIRPIYWNEDNLSPVINSLNQICTESINVSDIKTDIEKKESSFDISGLKGLKLLQKWLQVIFKEIDAENIMKPFFVLYDLRKVFHHDTGNEKQEILKSCYDRMKIPSDKGLESLYDALIKELTNSIDTILHSNVRE